MHQNEAFADNEPANVTGRTDRDRADEIFQTLGNRRRRFVLTHLSEHDGRTSVGDLAEELAAWENRVDRAAVTYKQRKRAYTSLIQIHLPTLSDSGFVEYDADRKTVGLGPEGESLARLLREERVGADPLGETEPVTGVRRWMTALYDTLGPRSE